jgi:hypothetical protein
VGLEIDEEAGGGALDSVEKLEVLGDGVSGFVEIVDFELDDDVVEAGGGVDGGDGGEGGMCRMASPMACARPTSVSART